MSWWPWAMRHYCFMDNVVSPTKNGLTAYRNRFKKDFKTNEFSKTVQGGFERVQARSKANSKRVQARFFKAFGFHFESNAVLREGFKKLNIY